MIGNRMSDGFITLHLEDAVGTAQSVLAENPNLIAVLYDEDQPVTIVTVEDLERVHAPADRRLVDIAGRLPPGVVALATDKMEHFVHRDEFSTFTAGARGAMVLDEDRLVGVLTQATITQYLRDEFIPAGEMKGLPSDTRLPGGIVDKPIIIYCEQFNHRNELKYYNRRKPPECAVKQPAPHPIRR